jgi:hypothetical protein
MREEHDLKYGSSAWRPTHPGRPSPKYGGDDGRTRLTPRPQGSELHRVPARHPPGDWLRDTPSGPLKPGGRELARTRARAAPMHRGEGLKDWIQTQKGP